MKNIPNAHDSYNVVNDEDSIYQHENQGFPLKDIWRQIFLKILKHLLSIIQASFNGERENLHFLKRK